MVRIGCDRFCYAVMTTEDTKTTAPVYGTITEAPDIISINVNPNGSLDTLFYNDGPGDSAATLGKIEVEINKAYLSTADEKTLLGHAIDSKGGLVYGGNDSPPWVAIGYRTMKSNGKYRYVWMYKGRFVDPEINSETKGESINFQTSTIKGQFAKLVFGYKVGGVTRYVWKYDMDEDDTLVDAATITGWFTKVTMPTAEV